MSVEDWSAKKWREEVENFAMEMWLGSKIARAVGVLSIKSFDEEDRPVQLATAALTLKFLKYRIHQEVKGANTAHLQNQ